MNRAVSKIMEYHPSLVIDDYELGSFCMFIRNLDIGSVKMPEDTQGAKQKNGDGKIKVIGTQDGQITVVSQKKEQGKIKVVLHGEDTTDEKNGGRVTVYTNEKEGVRPFDDYTSQKKQYAGFSYEAGYIIGINKQASKLYVQFSDTEENDCYIYKAGMPSSEFDRIDRLIQKHGR